MAKQDFSVVKGNKKKYLILILIIALTVSSFVGYYSNFLPKFDAHSSTGRFSLYEKTCPKLDGKNELKQWKMLWNVVPYQNISRSYKKRKLNLYQYRIRTITNNSEVVVMEIAEMYQRNKTEGGSSFRVEVTSRNNMSDITHLNLCHVCDKFNGFYIICCTLIPNMCNTISVYLMYQSFAAFAELQNRAPNVNKLWTKTWCFPFVKGADPPFTLCKNPPPMSASGHWIYINSKKRWTWMFDEPNKCIIRFLSKKQIRRCMLKINPFYLLGASHMRYNFDYLTKHLPGKWPKLERKHGDAQIGHVIYKNVQYDKELAKQLQKISESHKYITNESLLIIQNGAWDLAYSHPRKYILKGFPLIYRALKQISSESQWPKNEIIWFNAIAYPQKTTIIKARGKRNNFIIAAVNAIMEPFIKGLGIKIMDIFQITMPRNIDYVYGNHYISPITFYNNSHGYVGHLALQVFLGDICKNHKKELKNK